MLPGTGEERQSIVCHLRSTGEICSGAQEAAVLGGVVSSNAPRLPNARVEEAKQPAGLNEGDLKISPPESFPP